MIGDFPRIVQCAATVKAPPAWTVTTAQMSEDEQWKMPTMPIPDGGIGFKQVFSIKKGTRFNRHLIVTHEAFLRACKRYELIHGHRAENDFRREQP